VDELVTYKKQALQLARVTDLGANEGVAVRIPGFAGLMAVGATRKEALSELAAALDDWIQLALKRGIGLPALQRRRRLSAA
jgi:predicted RNase H-like HicB family nuclease